jgi:hypothetical protein
MEWMGSVVASLVLFLLVVPLAVAVGSVFLLGAAGWAFSGSPSVARTRFYCPFSTRWVTAEFLARSGAAQPADVISCSRFTHDGDVRCEKGCLNLVETGWTASAFLPRYALLSGGVAQRPLAHVAK